MKKVLARGGSDLGFISFWAKLKKVFSVFGVFWRKRKKFTAIWRFYLDGREKRAISRPGFECGIVPPWLCM
jgi:hypothetical protein